MAAKESSTHRQDAANTMCTSVRGGDIPPHHLIYTLDFSRQSKGTESITSQERRLTASVENVLFEYFPNRVIPYPVTFKCVNVNRNEVFGSVGFSALVGALLDGLPDLDTPSNGGKKPVVWILCVSLLRLGKDKEKLLQAYSSIVYGKFCLFLGILDCASAC